mmetsp:Transcript_106880/g.212234  ORF Transcript_106880/g.212234 Transcript_106880/m.212234 type:complete len:622 (+) Transcript_106880:118-1983(+)
MCARYVPPHLRRQQEEASIAATPALNAGAGHGDGDSAAPKSFGPGGIRSANPQPYVIPAARDRFDCLKEDAGGFRGRGVDRGHGGGRGGGNFGGSEGDWFHRRDGRRVNGWNSESEYAVFGERRSSEGINFDEYDKIPVSVTGRNCDENCKIERFLDADLSEPLAKNLQRCGYDRPTPVQKHSIPLVCNGRDLMACAQTGSGKTCAFIVPAVECLLRAGPPPMPLDNGRTRRSMPCVLVLAPTRELSSQIFDESRKFTFNTGIRSCVVYGGADMRDQRRELFNGCDVLVATPGRLTDMFEKGYISLGLIQFLILDEADRMLDMGFEPQVRQIIERTDMGSMTEGSRQSMMFSATFPREVQMMASDFLHDYVFLTVGRVGSASELVEQLLVYADDRDKIRVCVNILRDERPPDGLVLVFVETKRGADLLDRDFHNSGLDTCVIHGDRSQSEREYALAQFRNGRRTILIATDVASRGLDIPNVHLVVNFDMPKAIDDYVHRIGRTGRAGKKGKAIALINNQCTGPLLRDLRESLEEANQDWPDWFDDMCRQHRYGGGGGNWRGRRGGGGGGGRRFGGRDMRAERSEGHGGGWRGGAGNSGDRGGGGYPGSRQNRGFAKDPEAW